MSRPATGGRERTDAYGRLRSAWRAMAAARVRAAAAGLRGVAGAGLRGVGSGGLRRGAEVAGLGGAEVAGLRGTVAAEAASLGGAKVAGLRGAAVVEVASLGGAKVAGLSGAEVSGLRGAEESGLRGAAVTGLRGAAVAAGMALALTAGCRRHHRPPVADEPLAPATAPASAVAGNADPASGTAARVEPPSTAAAFKPIGRVELPDGGTLNGDARGPRAADFNRVTESATPALRGCFDAAQLPPGSSSLVVHYIVEPPGYTGGVTVSGGAPATVQECARQVVLALKFPEFHGPKVANDLPFTYTLTRTEQKTEIWDGGAPPQQNP